MRDIKERPWYKRMNDKYATNVFSEIRETQYPIFAQPNFPEDTAIDVNNEADRSLKKSKRPRGR